MDYVKDEIAKMDWEKDGFIKNKYAGFIAAIHMYDDVPVIFDEDGVYTLLSREDNNRPYTLAEAASYVRSCYKLTKGKDPTLTQVSFPRESEDYVDLGNDGYEPDPEICELMGLTEEDVEDILARQADLYGYFEVVISDNPFG
jgi:hypothetical protein